MKKFHSKKKIKISNVIVLLLVLILIGIIFTFKKIDKIMSPIIFSYAEVEAKKITTLVINSAVSEEVMNEINTEDIFIEKDNTVTINSLTVNKILKTVTNNIQKNLSNLENGIVDASVLQNLSKKEIKNLENGVVYQYPFGSIFEITLLHNIGPKIPVKLDFIGNIESSIDTDVTDYGINNSLVKVFVNVTVSQKMLLPFSKKEIKSSNNILIAMKLIEGKVPEYYSGSSNSNFSVPIN